MPVYVFCLDSNVASRSVIETHMDDDSARYHAHIVAEELNRNRDEPLGLSVYDGRGRLVHRATCSVQQPGRLQIADSSLNRLCSS